jgi:hypothetical protein
MVYQTAPADAYTIDRLNFVWRYIMGFATHLGPWLLGTVKNTTGTTAGTIRNTGCTIVAQEAPVVFGTLTGTAFVLPAGACVTSVVVVTTTVFSAATTAKLSIGGTDFTTTGTITSVGSVTLGANATTPGGWLNVGATDAIVTYTLAGTALTTGAATIIITYAVQGSNGGQFQTTFQN